MGGTSTAQRTSSSGCKAKPTVKLNSPANQYHNPDPIVRLISRKNENIIKIENQEFTSLIDPGAQISTICTSLVEKLKLPVHSLEQILYVEPIEGRLVAYEGYVEVNLKVPGVSALNEDVLMLVVNDSAYSERVPIALGTIHVDQVLQLIKNWEFKKMGESWQRSKLATVPAAKAAILAEDEKGFTLDQVNGDLKITKALTFAPFETAKVLTQSKVKNLRERVNVITEPPEHSYAHDVVTNPSYVCLKPGSSRFLSV